MSIEATVRITEDENIKDIMAQCYASTRTSCKILFPERFWLDFSGLHNEIFKVLDDDSIQQAVIAAPRGTGKTTIDTIAYPAKKILFQDKKFIVPISATATKAVMDGENLKRELIQNRVIKELFGPMKSDSFSKEQWITQNGIMVMPRGAGQQVRGILYDRYRPDLIIADDLEDPEAVKNEDLRAALREWWFSDVCNSINRSQKDWKIVIVGTVLHEDSLLIHLLNDPDWYGVRLELCGADLKSNWPDFMSDDEVRKLYESHTRRGQLDLFSREYQNLPVSAEDATFKQEYFKYYLETDSDFLERLRLGKIETILIVDPAKTTKMHSAESAIVVVGLDTENQRVYVRDVVSGKFHPDELYDHIFKLSTRFKVRVFGVEVTGLNEFITQPIRNEMMKRGLGYPNEMVELKARGREKSDRVRALVSYYRQGHMFHNESACRGLEAQLMSFPRSALWDQMDALAYFIEMAELGTRYFEPPPPENSEDEYKELRAEDEKPLEGWRLF